MRDHLAGSASGVADHARGGRDGGAGAQHRRARVGRRAGQDAGDALGVLVVVRPGHRPARRDVGGLESEQSVVGQVEADVDELDPAAIAQRVTGLRPPNVTVSAACTCGPSAAPVCTSMPLGMSTATTGIPPASTAANTSAASGRSGPEPEMPTTPSITRSVAGGTLSTTRPPAR